MVLGPWFVREWDTLDFGHAFLNYTYFRPCGQIWLSSVRRGQRLADEKMKERRRRNHGKYKSTDNYVGRPNNNNNWMGRNYLVGLPRQPPAAHCQVDNTQIYRNSRHIFSRQNFSGGHSPKREVLEVETSVAEKLYAGSRGRPAVNFVLLDKIHPSFCASFIVNQFSALTPHQICVQIS